MTGEGEVTTPKEPPEGQPFTKDSKSSSRSDLPSEEVLQRRKLQAEIEEIGKPLYKRTGFWAAMAPVALAVFAFGVSSFTGWFDVQRKELQAERKILEYDTKKLTELKNKLEVEKDDLEKKTGALAAKEEKLIGKVAALTDELERLQLRRELADLGVTVVPRDDGSGYNVTFYRQHGDDTLDEAIGYFHVLGDSVSLYLAGTQVSDLDPLEGFTALKELDLQNTPVSDLTPLQGLTDLRSLDLQSTPVSDLSPLRNLTALEELDLRSTQVTQVTDLLPLKGLNDLRRLDLRHTPFRKREIDALRAAEPDVLPLQVLTDPTRNAELASLDPREGYRWRALAGGDLDDTLLIVTASGRGTQATALALSTLRGLDRLSLASGRSLAEEVDVISSVSGGSVTAAYFALTGTAGFDKLEHDFIRRNGISALLSRDLTPVGLTTLASPPKERIDLLIDYLDDSLFKDAVFDDLRLSGKRPFLILNAGDMVEGTPFPLTQNQFDLICSDLSQLKMSVGVAASAAFPGDLSPVTLINYSPCASALFGTWPKSSVTNAADSSWHDNPGRVRRGRVARAYALGTMVPPPEGISFIHLLDGGILDSLGAAEPFRLLTTNEVSPSFFNQISKGKIRRVIFILVSAGSVKASERNVENATPGAIAADEMFNAAITAATRGEIARIETLLRERFLAAAAEMPEPLSKNFRNLDIFFLPVDFGAIEDDACRRDFRLIGTSWTLPEQEIDALMIVGQALLKSSPRLRRVARALGATGLHSLPEIEDACALMEAARR